MSRRASTEGTTVEWVADWRASAACRGEDPELFFPVSETALIAQMDIRRAKDICLGCPVRQACLDDAMDVEGRSGVAYRHGIRGGLLASERAALARRRGR